MYIIYTYIYVRVYIYIYIYIMQYYSNYIDTWWHLDQIIVFVIVIVNIKIKACASCIQSLDWTGLDYWLPLKLEVWWYDNSFGFLFVHLCEWDMISMVNAINKYEYAYY